MLSGGGQGGPPRPESPIARKTEAAPVLNKEQQRLPGLHEIPDPRDPILLEPPHQVEDALTLIHGLNKVRIAGLDAPNRHAVCFSEDESLWACGLRARAALYNLIRGEVIACMRVAAVKGGVIPASRSRSEPLRCARSHHRSPPEPEDAGSGRDPARASPERGVGRHQSQSGAGRQQPWRPPDG